MSRRTHAWDAYDADPHAPDARASVERAVAAAVVDALEDRLAACLDATDAVTAAWVRQELHALGAEWMT